jgi:hypothetical protein
LSRRQSFLTTLQETLYRALPPRVLGLFALAGMLVTFVYSVDWSLVLTRCVLINPWRNSTMHVESSYSEHAEKILISVRG